MLIKMRTYELITNINNLRNHSRGASCLLLDSPRKSVHKLGVDVKISWTRHQSMDEIPFYAYWGGGPLAWCSGRWQELRPVLMIPQFQTLSIGHLDFVPSRNLADWASQYSHQTPDRRNSFAASVAGLATCVTVPIRWKLRDPKLYSGGHAACLVQAAKRFLKCCCIDEWGMFLRCWRMCSSEASL